MNPLIAGNKLVAIFGFCDIRNFTDVTEILQERVMLFVNEIAQIVHANGKSNIPKHYLYKVHDLHGSANKNIGDAFLLVWKFPADVVKLI